MSVTLPPRARAGRGWSQRPRELAAFLELLVAEGVRTYLEVGARHGDTFAAVADVLPPGATLVAIDLPGAWWGTADSLAALEASAAYARARGHRVQVLVGDSTDAGVVAAARAYAPFDAVLLDGDHREAGVRSDWRHYGPMGRLVAFHDIAPTEDNAAIAVPVVWAEVAATHRTLAIVDPDAPGMGLGVCWRTA